MNTAVSESHKRITGIVRKAVALVEMSNPDKVKPLVEPIREELVVGRGLDVNCHFGSKELETDPEMTVEWYAGQLLDIVDAKAWYAMNSIINCLDKFVPELE